MQCGNEPANAKGDAMAKIVKIELVGKSALAGCNKVKVYAGSGKGAKWKPTGHKIVDLPSPDASFAQFVAGLGGEKEVRKHATSGKLVAIRGEIANEIKQNGKASSKGGKGIVG